MSPHAAGHPGRSVVKVSCASDHKRSTVATFELSGQLGVEWPTRNVHGEPVDPRSLVVIQGGTSVFVKGGAVQPYLPFDEHHETITLRCPRCTRTLSIRHPNLRSIVTAFADRGNARVELADLIYAASALGS